MSKVFTVKEINEGVITDLSIREKLADHIEALDRAGKLLTMPKVNMATTQQIADFFGVPLTTVKSAYDRNKSEIDLDGVRIVRPAECVDAGCVYRRGIKGVVYVKVEDTEVAIPNSGIRLFPKRAVLRIAMLLTGSEVAKQVRTFLLNLTEKVVENAPQLVEQVYDELTAEMPDTLRDIAVALANGNFEAGMRESMKINKWYSGKIVQARQQVRELCEANEALGTANDMLRGEYAPLTPRKTVVNIILAVNNACGRSAAFVKTTYDEFYKELRLHEGIDVKKRRLDGVTGKQLRNPPSLISLIRDDEWKATMRCLAWFCSRYSVDPWYATNDATVEKYHLESAEYDGKVYTNKKMRVWKIEDVPQAGN